MRFIYYFLTVALLFLFVSVAGSVMPFSTQVSFFTPPARAAVQSATPAAYFEFTYPPYPETFIVKLTDPSKIAHARKLLNGSTKNRSHIMGTVVKYPAGYNKQWSYYLSPSSIQFFDLATEVCDASILYVEQNLSQAGGSFLPNSTWCPWGSALIREIKPTP